MYEEQNSKFIQISQTQKNLNNSKWEKSSAMC